MKVDFEKLYERPQSASELAVKMGIELPQTDDMAELARSAVPELVRKAIILAAGSDKLSEVLSVLKELADRGYGKPAQTMAVKADISGTVVIRDDIA